MVLFNMNLAAWCCIISSLLIDVCWYGSHIVELYSIEDKTICFKHAFLSKMANDRDFYVRILASRQFALL